MSSKSNKPKIEMLVLSIATNHFKVPLPTGAEVVRAINSYEDRERLLNISLDLLCDVYESRASQRFSAIGLSRIQSHVANLRAELAPNKESESTT